MKYKRILLKLSGEAIGGADGVGLDEDVMKRYAFEIAQVVKKGVQVAIVIGGGNIFRGLAGTERGKRKRPSSHLHGTKVVELLRYHPN